MNNCYLFALFPFLRKSLLNNICKDGLCNYTVSLYRGMDPVVCIVVAVKRNMFKQVQNGNSVYITNFADSLCKSFAKALRLPSFSYEVYIIRNICGFEGNCANFSISLE